MRVGLLHYTGPPVVGGVEQTLAHHARHLAASGHTPVLIVGEGQPPAPGVVLRRVALVHSRHPQVLAVKRELDAGVVDRRYHDLVARLRRELLRATRDLDCLIVHNVLGLHKNLALTAALWELHRNNAAPRLIAWHHDLAWDRPDYAAELHPGEPWDLLRQAWPGVVQVTVSAHQQTRIARLLDVPAESITVIPPGVDRADFGRWGAVTRRLYRSLGLDEADLVLLFPTRITRRKNIEQAIAITAALARAGGLDARLLVTGPPGPHNQANQAYRMELVALCRKLGVDSAVHFLHGRTPGARADLDDATVAELFDVADALLFTSRAEGFGIPLLEAGLARLPVFAADLDVFRESGGADVTYLGPDEPPEESARRILAALEASPAHRLRRRVLSDFTWSGLVRRRLLPLLGSHD